METRICIKCKKEKDISNYRILTRKHNNSKHFQTTCKNCEKEMILNKRKQNQEQYNEYQKKYRDNNKEKKKQLQKKYYSNELNKYKRNKSKLLRTIIIKKGEIKSNTLDYFGLSCKDLYNYLVRTYEKNYLEKYNEDIIVQLDHIIPLCSAKTKEEVDKLNYYTNLQLLKPIDNLKKGRKILN